MGFSCGIVGLPNVGKSTIFNALSSAKAQAANFPFCTIEPNTGMVAVSDPRLSELAKIAKSEKIIPTQLSFVDIAGLIRGASKGEGLGNQFLGHIRGVDAIAHVVRVFDDSNVVHVEGSLDPLRDIETIETELLLSDIETLQKQLNKYERAAKTGDKQSKEILGIIEPLINHLSNSGSARTFVNESLLTSQLTSTLISAKPVLYVANVSEAHIKARPGDGTLPELDKLEKYAKSQNSTVLVICGQLESEVAELDAKERSEYLKEMGMEGSGLDRLSLLGYKLLNLITFFTVGPKETHAWTASAGTKAPQCAGKIHSDFEKGFIRAEIIGYGDYVSAGGEVKSRELGKMRLEGKDYIMQDGDVVHFRFNV